MKSKNRIKDLTGKKFGMLTAIGIDDSKKGRKTYWVCQCDCGNVKSVRSDTLQSGCAKSCGCLKAKQDKVNLTANHSHKMSGSRIYNIWQGMKARCNNPNNVRYHRYGGRGIKVCEEWEESFEAFYQWAKDNGYSEAKSIDRVDNNKGYAPNNCRWATDKQQANNRCTNVNITIGNATKTLTQWCEIFKVDSKKVFARYNNFKYRTVEDLFNG